MNLVVAFDKSIIIGIYHARVRYKSKYNAAQLHSIVANAVIAIIPALQRLTLTINCTNQFHEFMCYVCVVFFSLSTE